MNDVLESLRVQILSAEPGDVVLVTTDQPMTQARVDRIREVFDRLLPSGVTVGVMDQGLHVDSVIRPKE